MSADAEKVRSLLLLAIACLSVAAPAQAKPRDGVLHHVADTDGIYYVSGTLRGVRPPREPVRELRITRLTAEDLQPLLAFKDLRTLELEAIVGVDLAPLTQLPLESLDIVRARDVDLSPVGAIPTLKRLGLSGLREVRIPAALPLPPDLQDLYIDNDGFRLTGAPVKALISAVDWSRLGNLRSLGLQVGGLEPLRPIHADLGLLRSLPRLQYLSLIGVHHEGHERSPLAMPFPGLARSLRRVDFDAWRPRRTQRALQRRLPHAAISVDQRYAWKPGRGSWTLYRSGGSWNTYGSFWDAADGADGETEWEALATARRRLHAKAPRLLKRLDFDSESSGTGVSAPSRRDLVRMLRILGIR